MNALTVYNRKLSYFDEKLFSMLLDFCKKKNSNIIYKPDYILNNITGQQLIDGIENFKLNMQSFRNWIKKDKKYDLIGEVSIDYLTNPNNIKKLIQTKKYIDFIKLFNSIEKENEIKFSIKANFEKLFGLINENEKVLIMTSDGNYESYLYNLKQSNIFKNDTDNNEYNNNLSLDILNEVKKSGINFIITYVPRAYVNIKPIYSNDNEIEKLKNNMEILNKRVTEEKKRFEDKVKLLTEENKRVGNEIKKVTEENKALNHKIDDLKKEIKILKNK